MSGNQPINSGFKVGKAVLESLTYSVMRLACSVVSLTCSVVNLTCSCEPDLLGDGRAARSR